MTNQTAEIQRKITNRTTCKRAVVAAVHLLGRMKTQYGQAISGIRPAQTDILKASFALDDALADHARALAELREVGR